MDRRYDSLFAGTKASSGRRVFGKKLASVRLRSDSNPNSDAHTHGRDFSYFIWRRPYQRRLLYLFLGYADAHTHGRDRMGARAGRAVDILRKRGCGSNVFEWCHNVDYTDARTQTVAARSGSR